MQGKYQKEINIKNREELEVEIELMRNIIKTKNELENDSRNFEYAENELIDYYIYHIKANKFKLDYLIKIAKTRGMKIDIFNENEYADCGEEIS